MSVSQDLVKRFLLTCISRNWLHSFSGLLNKDFIKMKSHRQLSHPSEFTLKLWRSSCLGTTKRDRRCRIRHWTIHAIHTRRVLVLVFPVRLRVTEQRQSYSCSHFRLPVLNYSVPCSFPVQPNQYFWWPTGTPCMFDECWNPKLLHF